MAVQSAKGRSWVKLFLKLFLLAVITVAIVVPALTAVNFCRHADKLIFYLETKDSEGAKRELDKLHYFYTLSGKWKVQWLADEYLFNDAYFYQVAHLYSIENRGSVIEALKEKLDDPRSYPYANAKFRQAQIKYQAGKKKEALELALGEIHQDYERDLRNCLKSSEYMQCWDRVWNFDLTSNKKDAEEALKQPKIPPEFILGPLKEQEEKPGGPEPEGEPPGGKKLDEEKPGSSGPRRMP